MHKHASEVEIAVNYLQEYEMSLKCSTEPYLNNDDCTQFFLNYRNCMNFWVSVSV